MVGRRADVLLADSSYFGTLAAVRDLGRLHTNVLVADSFRYRTMAQASRFCGGTLRSPALHDRSILSWLLKTGAAYPGAFLYPTSDEMVWIMAVHHEALSQHFKLFQPSGDSSLSLLDKSRLYARAKALGIAIPSTHAPTSLEEFRALGDTLQRAGAYPVMVKPRTQACMSNQIKGIVAYDANSLLRAARSMTHHAARYGAEMADALPDLQWPLVQAYVADACHDTYSLAGFIDREGRVRAARASVKVFQLPVRAGIGVAFEGRPVRADLLADVQRLAAASGYVGVFEVEFLHDKARDRYLLVDFNPRFYGQMQFEIARGMHLPRMVYSAAVGDEQQLAALCEKAKESLRTSDADQQRYCNQWLFRILLRTQRWGGNLTLAEQERWLSWMEQGEMFDAVRDDDDRAPQHAKRRFLMRGWIRHPRASFRSLFR